MTNRVVKTTTQGWLSRIMGSFVGVLFGIGLFLGSFFVLWNNEGRTDLSTIADDSVAIPAASVDPANEGKLVAASGVLAANEPLGDPDYLRPGAYLTLERDVEMYAWIERTSSTTETNLGGSETTTTEYTYEMGWTSNPANSSNFEVPQGHENPALNVQDAEFTASSATVGAFNVDLNSLSLPSSRDVALTNEMLASGVRGQVNSNFLYLRNGSASTPRVGDVRVSFSGVPSGQNVTTFAKQEGNALVPFVRGNDRLYLAHVGDRQSGIDALHSSYQTTGWIFRIVGFFMMWIGMGLVSGPLSTFLDVVPIFGKVSRSVIGFITFGVSLLLTIITVVIAMIMHNIIALLLLLLVIIGIGAFLYWRTKSTSPSTPAEPKAA